MAALDFPANPTNGQVYGNWIYNSSKVAWQAKPLTPAKTITDDVAPLNPADGDQWFSTVDGVLYIYVVDIDGGQWVESRSAIISDGYYSPNYIINGGFDIWQRGTSTSVSPGAANLFIADRWNMFNNVGSSTVTASQQTFTPGSAPVSGYEGKNFFRLAMSGYTSSYLFLGQKIEDVRTLAGQTATLSFWAKANSALTLPLDYVQWFGSGGSGAVNNSISSVSVTTSWQRFTLTFTVPSLAGKTIGTAGDNSLEIRFLLGANNTLDIWGVQLESGSVATPFRRNANSLQGELAACQRYYYRYTQDESYKIIAQAATWGANETIFTIPLPSSMRIFPTSISVTSGSLWYFLGNGTNYTTATNVTTWATRDNVSFNFVGLNVPTNVPTHVRPNLNSYWDASAEL